VLQRAGVLAVIGQFETAGMAEHMRVHAEWHLRRLPKPRDHSAEARGTHGHTALAQEHVAPRLLLALEAP